MFIEMGSHTIWFEMARQDFYIDNFDAIRFGEDYDSLVIINDILGELDVYHIHKDGQ